MAARAHVAPDYSFGNEASRPRRDVYYRREDPVVLPRSRGFSLDYRLIAAALAATALVTAATYGVFSASAPTLAETPTLPLVRDWSPGIDTGRASMLKALAGPSLSTRSLAAAPLTASDAAADAEASAPPANFPQSTVPSRTAPQSPPASARSPRDSSSSSSSEEPKVQDLVPELPPTPEVYPNPTSTPPEGVAPPEVSPEVPTPALDPENPYR